jgi:hypothetical protein
MIQVIYRFGDVKHKRNNMQGILCNLFPQT